MADFDPLQYINDPEDGQSMYVRMTRSSRPLLVSCRLCEHLAPCGLLGPVLMVPGKILNIPIYATTQNAARLGSTVSEVTSLFEGSTPTPLEVDKTAFSMLVPQINNALFAQASSSPHTPSSISPASASPLTIILVGIETHICVTQTTLDLLSLGHKVYILQDGVSSCNAGERPIALARLAREGAVVTTSESVLFELVQDASDKNFKAIAGLVKEMKEETKKAVETFCGGGGRAEETGVDVGGTKL